jgi:glycosyltransferase involved in cell wall biosynthesis
VAGGAGDELLVVVSSTARRGAQLQALALTDQLRAAGTSAQVVALAPAGDLQVSALGPRPLAPTTLLALRRRAAVARLVVAFGSTTLPASAIALAGGDTPFVYRSIGDPAAWVRGDLHRRRTGFLMRRAAHVVTLWPDAAAAVIRLYGVRPERTSSVPNARDPRRFTPPSDADRQAARDALDLEARTIAVAFIGSLTAEKRSALAAEAVGRVPNARLLVVGDGPGRAELERRADVALTVLGRQADVRRVLHAADVVLSTSSTEGMPGALIEAALCGVPAVATDVGAVAAVVGGGGEVVSADAGAEELAAAVERVGARSRELGAAAREHAVARFTWEAVLPRWLDVLARVGR